MQTRLGPPDESVTREEVDGSLLLMNPVDSTVLVLNETASAVWDLCDGTLTSDEIVRLLARAYGMDPEDVRLDVEAVLHRFVDEGFLPGAAG